MYATIVCCELGAERAADARECATRALARSLAALPGFIATVAIETDATAGTVTAVCIVEGHAGLAEVEEAIARWQGEQGAVAWSPCRVGAGEVIAQKGL